MNGYILSTWALANLAYPVILFFTDDLASGLGFFFQFIIWTFIFSLPSLLISLLAGYFLSGPRGSVPGKFIIWLLTAPVIVLINFFLLSVIFDDGGFEFFEWELTMPAMLAVTVVILIRHKPFFKYFNKINKDETTLV